ncbi:Hypothetical predicted protein [Cloeon dipterum]|uniref:Uncharacterized protein n=1 Tax=Cloeon dipterum TaxID=197152 RepID=A0A8S1E483_9INSE|nr:Hypothetical predicted protein [Cloeon dipterum]
MILNAKKCKVMDITHERVLLQYEYTLGAENMDKERLLGVHITSDLRCHAHTEIVRAKAASFAVRNLRGCTPRVKRVAYLTFETGYGQRPPNLAPDNPRQHQQAGESAKEGSAHYLRP